jgi:hypothetical protein
MVGVGQAYQTLVDQHKGGALSPGECLRAAIDAAGYSSPSSRSVELR